MAAVGDYLRVRGAGPPRCALSQCPLAPTTSRAFTYALRRTGELAGVDSARLSAHCLRISVASHGSPLEDETCSSARPSTSRRPCGVHCVSRCPSPRLPCHAGWRLLFMAVRSFFRFARRLPYLASSGGGLWALPSPKGHAVLPCINIQTLNHSLSLRARASGEMQRWIRQEPAPFLRDSRAICTQGRLTVPAAIVWNRPRRTAENFDSPPPPLRRLLFGVSLCVACLSYVSAVYGMGITLTQRARCVAMYQYTDPESQPAFASAS